MLKDGNFCQGVHREMNYSTSRPARIKRIYWYMNQNGLLWTCNEFLRRLKVLKNTDIQRKDKKQHFSLNKNMFLNLKPGEMVEIKSEKEIRQTLDSLQRTEGLKFMPEMWKYCGKRYRVYKKLNKIISEASGELLKLKNTVLLDGVICDGSEHYNCERSCFLWWKEHWLNRVEK
jgi:hypothetical protein